MSAHSDVQGAPFKLPIKVPQGTPWTLRHFGYPESYDNDTMVPFEDELGPAGSIFS